MKKRLLTFLFLVLGVLYSNAQMACEAGFQANLSNCPDIAFINSSIPGGGSGGAATIISWDWDFGDGNTSMLETPMNTYPSNGDYIVCLTIVTDNGCTSTICDTVSIPCLVGIEELNNTPKQLLKVTDFMGRETLPVFNTPLIYYYSDGTTERVIKLEE